MKKQNLKVLFIIVALLLVIYPSFRVQAKVCKFSNMYMEVTVPEDTIILTKDIPIADEVWSKAGITDPKTEKSNMNKMGTQAILYNPETGIKVNLLQKQSKQSRDVFNLSLLTEEEFKTFREGLITVKDENTVVSVEKYPQQEIPFFRASIEVNQENALMKEIIIGTIVNGYAISYDCYDANSTKPLDESFIKELVAGTHFTEFLDKAEVERQGRIASFIMMAIIAAIIVLIVLWVFRRKRRLKNETILKNRKLELLEQFYKDHKLKEEQHITETALYLNRTRYTEDIIKNYFYYNEIYKRIKLWIVTGILSVILFITYYQSNSSLLSWFIALAILFVFIYYMGTQIEKRIKLSIKSNAAIMDKEVVVTFYENYLSVSGIQTTTVIPYVQITEIREYKGFIYIYHGISKAFYLKKDGFEHGEQDFMKFMKERINIT